MSRDWTAPCFYAARVERLTALLATSRAQTWRARRERDAARAEVANRGDQIDDDALTIAKLRAELERLRAELAEAKLRLRVILGDGDDPNAEEVAPEAAW